MPTSLIAPLVSAGVSYGANALFGGGSSKGPDAIQSYVPPGFDAGGLKGSFTGNGYSVTPSADRLGAVGNISGTFGTQADLLAGLRARVAPGISDLRAAKLNEIENQRTASVGNLRDNLARRRVLGSSFGQDSLARADAEFGKAKAQASAESFLQEMEMSNNLLQQEFTARRGQFQTTLDEMNLEANLASNLTGKATDILGKNAQIESQLQMLSQQSAGKFFGQTFGPVATAAGNAVGGLFKGGGGGSNWTAADGAANSLLFPGYGTG
jgi:hypothetical protein